METTNEPVFQEKERTMELTQKTLWRIRDIGKWTMFFSVLGFVTIALMFIASIYLMGFFNKIAPFVFPQGKWVGLLVGIFYMIFGSIYIVPIVFLFKFSRFSKKSVSENDSALMEKAFSNLFYHYQFVGILVILMLAIYGLILFIVGISALALLIAK